MSAWVYLLIAVGLSAVVALAFAVRRLMKTADVWIAAERPVGGSGRKRIAHMLKEGFSVGRIARELKVSRGLVLSVKVHLEMEGKQR